MTISTDTDKFGLANIIKRKFYWTACITSKDGKTTHLPKILIKLNPSPIHDDEKSTTSRNDHICEFKYSKYQSVTIMMDVQIGSEELNHFCKWLASIYKFSDQKNVEPIEVIPPVVLVIQMYNSCNMLVESFILKDCYPAQIKFSEFDLGNVECSTIELILRYTELEARDEMEIEKIKEQKN